MKESIFESEKVAKLKAYKVLELAKELEKKKSKTHVWQTSPDGKTKNYVKRN